MNVSRKPAAEVRRLFHDICARFRAKQVPTRLQYQTTECGVAVLAMILAYHGRYVPMEDIRCTTGVSRDCLNAADMVRAGRHYGLECAAYSREPDDLRQMAFPFVAHLKFIHFVVVEGMTSDRVLVNDPACGRSEIPIEQFDEIFTGIVIKLHPGPQFTQGGQKDRLSVSLWQRIDGGTISLFALALAATCLAPLPLVSLAETLGDSIGNVASGDGLEAAAMIASATLILVYAVISVIPALTLERARQRMSIRHTTRSLKMLIDRPFAYLSYRLPREQVKSVYGSDQIASLLCRDIFPAILTIPAVVVFLVSLLRLDLKIGSAAITVILLNVISQAALVFWRGGDVRKAALGADKDFQGLLGHLSSIENDKVAGMDMDYIAGNMGKQADRAIHDQRAAIANAAGYSVARTMEYGVVFGTALVAGIVSRSGGVDVSGIVIAVFLSGALAHAMRDWPRLRGKIDALYLALLRQNDLDNASANDVPVSKAPAPDSSPLQFRDIVFGHSITRPPLLKGVDFAFNSNAEQVGITGPSGGGKSTFASVAAGLHAPWTGTLEAGDGVLWIDKTPFLFEGTIRENLRLWRQDMDDAILERALKDACLYDMIASRPGGIDALVLARGHNFSGGQRQRLEIARALTFGPRVLILDEALDALNFALEQKLRANLRARGCALIVISHRTSTLDACDRVLHFVDGRLQERAAEPDPAGGLGARMQIETIYEMAKAPGSGTQAQGVDVFQAATPYTRAVRFQQRRHWQQPHLPLLARRRGSEEWVRLLPVVDGYRIENETKTVHPDDFEDGFRCSYENADLATQSPGLLFRNWVRIARSDYLRAVLLSAAIGVTVVMLAILASSPFSSGDIQPTWKLYMSLVGGMLITGLLEGARQLSTLRAEHRVRITACSDLFQRIIRIRPGFFRRTPPAELARALAGWYRLQDLLQYRKTVRAADVVIMAVGCLALGWLDLRLGLAVASMASLMVGICWWASSPAVPLKRNSDSARLTGRRFLSDMMQGIARLHVVGGAARAAGYWQYLFARECGFSAHYQTIKALRRMGGDLWLYSAMLVTVLIAANYSQGVGYVWYVAAALLFAWPAYSAVLRVGEAVADTKLAGGTLPDLRRLLRAPMEQAGTPVTTAFIELRAVGFHYEGSDTTALQDISLKIMPGEFIALVGPSGSGKSTLLRLVLEFERPSQGCLLLDEKDVEDIDILSWRRGIGVVQQDDRVTDATTIRSVISGLADVDLADVWRAADLAALGDDIRAMPMGMQTIVEHGKLSTGQEQRLLIAAQLLRRPSMLILDEATNAIPEDMQARIFANLRAEGIGCILATHRESAIAGTDRVIVLADGQLVWEGDSAAFAANRDFMELINRERLVEGDE